MSPFTYHTVETAPEASREMLSAGFNPNIYAIMAEAPPLLSGYKALWDLFAESSLSPLEQQVVMMTANYENNCAYCVPWHTYAMHAAKMPEDIIEALRNGSVLADAKLEALRVFTRAMLDHRGHVGDEQLQVLFDAGYTKRQALEVVLGLAVKVMSNFTNAIAHTELDAPPQRYVWRKPE